MEKDLSNLIWSSGIDKLVTGSNEQQTWRQFATVLESDFAIYYGTSHNSNSLQVKKTRAYYCIGFYSSPRVILFVHKYEDLFTRRVSASSIVSLLQVKSYI
jgi:hypothetical protein